MPFEMDRATYAALYGPTAGDKIRLGDTELWAYVEKDYTPPGEEVLWGFGKNLREGMMTTSRVPRASELDLIIANAVIIDPVLGVIKANIGVKEGRITAIGNAGNPDIKDNVDLVIGTATTQLQAEGLIATPGGIDSHVHLMTPRLMPVALASGLTTIITAGTRDNPGYNIHRLLEAFEEIPLNVCVLGRGNSRRPEPMLENVEAGCGGLKIHEDYAAYPEVIDACLQVADQTGVAVALHTDTINESCQVDETIEAIAGRAVHAYHVEGAGGGHNPDNLVLAGQPNIVTSSTNPTIPYAVNTLAEHLDMIMTCHALSYRLPEDVAAARSRIRAATVAAEDVLHDLGAISIMSSDSQGMGRIGETVRRTWQLADKMKQQLGAPADHDNERILQYVAKYTINPAITHGIADHVGSLEPGKLADIVLWRPAFFGAKPEMIIKNGFLVWAATGDGNATVRGAEPVYYSPMWGGLGNAVGPLAATFTSDAALASGVARRLGTRRHLLPVRNTRRVAKRHMVRNSLVPTITVDPQTAEVRVNGEVATCDPVERVPLNQLYFLA